jgi:hypothetical protein
MSHQRIESTYVCMPIPIGVRNEAALHLVAVLLEESFVSLFKNK